MAELKDKFTKLVKAVGSEAPELLPVLEAYKPDTWPTLDRAEEIYAEIRDRAKSGTLIADSIDYSKWGNEDCTVECLNKGLSYDYVSVRGNTRVIRGNGCELDTLYQSDGQMILWREDGISIGAGNSTIYDNHDMMQFKAYFNFAYYTVNIYKSRAKVIRKTELVFSQDD